MQQLHAQSPLQLCCRPQHYTPVPVDPRWPVVVPSGSAGMYPAGACRGQQPLLWHPPAYPHAGQQPHYAAPHLRLGQAPPGTGHIHSIPSTAPVISVPNGYLKTPPTVPLCPLPNIPLNPLLTIPGRPLPTVLGGPLPVVTGETRTLQSDGSSSGISSDDERTSDGGSPGTSVLGGSSCEVYNCLRTYLLKPSELLELGYPVESALFPGKAMILRTSDPSQPRSQGFNVDVKEFVPMGSDSTMSLNRPSPIPLTSDRNSSQTPPKTGAMERKCVRCKKYFLVTDNGEYMSSEHCFYHWGRLYPNPSCPSFYLCCKGIPSSQGCSTCRRHVWSGISTGMNGPLECFVRTLPRENPSPEDGPDIYALDCEMGFTVRGLELLKVTVVSQDGSVKYESLVRPDAEILDYNTRFSGVKEEDYHGNFKTLREVQSDLTVFIKEDTILIGHGLENDLRALRMVHSSCVDTAVVFPHRRGLPFRRALRDLVSHVLGRSIQDNPAGHDSAEDARACLDLVRYKIYSDFKITF